MMGAAEIAPVLYVSFLSAILCIVIGVCLSRRDLRRKQRNANEHQKQVEGE
jgi:hypothetical protein